MYLIYCSQFHDYDIALFFVAMESKKEKETKGKNFRWSKPMHNLLLEIFADETDKGNKLAHIFKVGSLDRKSVV